MNYSLICTSYNVLPDGSFQLRNNWVEPSNDEHLSECLNRWNIGSDFKYPSKNSISNILSGRMENGAIIHLRIIRF